MCSFEIARDLLQQLERQRKQTHPRYKYEGSQIVFGRMMIQRLSVVYELWRQDSKNEEVELQTLKDCGPRQMTLEGAIGVMDISRSG